MCTLMQSGWYKIGSKWLFGNIWTKTPLELPSVVMVCSRSVGYYWLIFCKEMNFTAPSGDQALSVTCSLTGQVRRVNPLQVFTPMNDHTCNLITFPAHFASREGFTSDQGEIRTRRACLQRRTREQWAKGHCASR